MAGTRSEPEGWLLGQAIERVGVAVAQLDRELYLGRVSDGLCAALGRDRGELEGRAAEEVLGSDVLCAALRRARDRGEPAILHELPWPAGCWDWSARPLRDASGAVVGLVVWAQEAGERATARVAAARAEAAGRRKEEMLAVLSHELRNPLAPILNSVQLMRRAAGSPSILEKAQEMIEQQVRQMVRLVEDLVDVSRLARAKIRLDHSPVEAVALVREAAGAARSLIDTAGQQLVIRLPAGPLAIEADAARLKQLVASLLARASRVSPPGFAVELGLAREGDEVALRVRDGGRGLPSGLAAPDFDPFAATEDSRTPLGSGLALALAKGLAELHGGRVEALVEDGACEVRVRLPLRRGDPAR